MIVKCLNAGRHLFGFVVTSSVDIGDGHKLSVGNRDNLLEQFLPAVSYADHPNADTIICAKHARSRISEESRRAQRRLFEKIPSCVVCHDGVPRKEQLTTLRHLAKVFSFLPNSAAMILP